MTQAVKQILSQLVTLSPNERAELAYAFLVSLEPEEDGVEEAWDVELTRRLREIRSRQAGGKPADLLFAELRENRS